MSDNWFYEYFINEAKSIIRPGSGGGSVPKPLTYDYMPEGYPSKAVQTATLMEEQEVAFAFDSKKGVYAARLTEALAITEGQTYTVNWDGTEYECVCYVFNSRPILGNLSIMGDGDDTGEPFIYISTSRFFITLDTSASHTISVKTVTEVITPMAYDYMPEGYPKKRGCSIEWDGNTEGLVAVEAGSVIICKVSDLTPTDDELIGRFVRISDGTDVIISSDYIRALPDDITLVGEGDTLIFVVKKDNATAEGLTFPQKGTYFVKQQNSRAAQPKPLYVQKLTEVITPMAVEFIPPRIVEAIDSIGTVAYNAQSTANNALSTANNAQTTANNAQSTANNAVKYTASQNLTDAQKQQARTNIGAGTSSFSGNYNDLANKPTIVQGDWDVNNDADMAYIKNRTHYTEINTEAIVEKEILYYQSVKGDENVSSLSYILSNFGNLGIPGTFNIAQGDILKIDRYREPTNSQYPYVDTIYGELTKITGKSGYDYVYYVFGNAYLFKNVTDPVLKIDISSDYDNGITYAGFIEFAYYNGELQSDYSAICLMVPNSMVGPNVFDISILSSTIHMLDEKYIPKTIQRVGDDVILSSSTSGSTKKFRITVDDTGTLSATEVT